MTIHRPHVARRALLSMAVLQGLLAPAGFAWGQDSTTAATADEPAELDAVYVTGSRLKRVDSETALPVEIVTREEIQKRGVTTAAEIVKTLSANTAPLSDGASITDGTSGQSSRTTFFSMARSPRTSPTHALTRPGTRFSTPPGSRIATSS